MNVLVLGWYNHSNVGDEAYKVSFPKVFGACGLHCCDFRFTDSVKSEDLNGIDLIVLGGGDVASSYFIDQIKTSPIKKIALSVTIHPGSALTDLSVFDQVVVRDQKSLEVAKPYVDSKKLKYCSDFAFALEADKPHGKDLIDRYLSEAHITNSRRNVVVVINNYISFINPDHSRKGFVSFCKMAQDLGEAFDNKANDVNFVFVPFGTARPCDDRISNSFVSGSCTRGNNVVVYDQLGVQDTLDIIGGADVVVSTRLHSSIFATLSQVPFIDIFHHDKNIGFLKTVGLMDWGLPFWKFDGSLFETLLEKQLNCKNVETLTQYTDKARKELARVPLLIS